MITIARVRKDFKRKCIGKKEENHQSGVCIVVSLSWRKQIEKVLFVFSMCRVRYGRVTIIAVRIFENTNDTSFDAPPVRRHWRWGRSDDARGAAAASGYRRWGGRSGSGAGAARK